MNTVTNLHPWQQMVASSAGSLVVSLFATPFDVVKVRLQAELQAKTVKCSVFNELVESICLCAQPPMIHNSAIFCDVHGDIRKPLPRFSSSTDAFIRIAQKEGIGKLWKGLSPTLIQMVPQTVIYFTAYDQLKVKFGYADRQIGVVAPLTSGVTARSFAVVAVSPIEMVRTKLQSKKNMRYRELIPLVHNSIKHEGFFSMWKGIGPTLLRDVPFSGIYWVGYECLKSVNPTNSVAATFVSGALAGMVAAALTTPFDVVKTHRQMELGNTNKDALRKRSRFTCMLLAKLYRTQGFSSLFTGVYPRLVKVSAACAIMITTYEYGKKYFAHKNILIED